MNTLRGRREQLHYRSNNFGRLRIINHFSVSTELIIANPLKVNYPEIGSLDATLSGNFGILNLLDFGTRAQFGPGKHSRPNEGVGPH